MRTFLHHALKLTDDDSTTSTQAPAQNRVLIIMKALMRHYEELNHVWTWTAEIYSHKGLDEDISLIREISPPTQTFYTGQRNRNRYSPL